MTAFALRIKTRLTAQELDALASKHCQKPVELSFDGLEERGGLSYKRMLLSFSTETDRVSFQSAMKPSGHGRLK